MPNEQHTPGPWFVIPDSSKETVLCDIGGPTLGNTVVAENIEPADAALIAAAPDMLAALQLVIYRPEGWPNVEPGALVELASKTKDAVKAAIAKATDQPR